MWSAFGGRERLRRSLGGDGGLMCGEVGCLHCGFTSATPTSIVGDYYELFNYSGDIYQGQLYRAASCRENGLSVLLLHSQAEEREQLLLTEALQVKAETSGWTFFFFLTSLGSVPPAVPGVSVHYMTSNHIFNIYIV